MNKLGYTDSMEYYTGKIKEQTWYKQQLWWVSRVYAEVKKANPKKLHTVWFHYITFWNANILEMENGISGCQGLGVGVGMRSRGQEEGRYGLKGQHLDTFKWKDYKISRNC